MRIRRYLLMLVCVCAISTPISALAQYNVPYSAVSGGGGRVTDGSLYVYSTIGQPAIGVSTVPANQVKSGYWYVLDALQFGPWTEVTFVAVGARLSDDGVVLHWEIGDASGLKGFNVYRSTKEGSEFARLNESLLPADKNTFVDEKAKPGSVYWYAVGGVDLDGEALSLVVKMEVPIKETTLFQNYPNPFNPVTTIAFYLPEVPRGRVGEPLIRRKVQNRRRPAGWRAFYSLECGNSAISATTSSL